VTELQTSAVRKKRLCLAAVKDAVVNELKVKLERFELDAVECELMALLSIDADTRKIYSQTASHYRELAADVRNALATKHVA
jgi:hypothetical protein